MDTYIVTTDPDAGDESDANAIEAIFDPTAAVDIDTTAAQVIEVQDFSADTVTDASTLDAEGMEAQAHAQAAAEAQARSDAAIEAGDYAAAQQERELAETESGAAGDSSMLHGSDSIDLTTAAEKQEDAAYYEGQQAQHAAAGDYEAAREDATNAMYATDAADFGAGGADHTGQAEQEIYQMDNAVWHQDIAEDNVKSADYYAAQGDTEMAEMHLGNAAEEQAIADHHGDLGEHGGDMAVHDPTSVVANDTSYDAGMSTTYDTSSTSTVDYSSATDLSSE